MQYKKPTFNRVAFSEHHEYLHDWTIEGSSLAFWQHFNPAGGFLASNLGGPQSVKSFYKYKLQKITCLFLSLMNKISCLFVFLAYRV